MKISDKTITYVKAVAEEHSFSKAAEKLYISQPSLSQYILNAEKEYGVQLFDRRSVPIRLTYAGERFLATAEKIELLEKQFSREMEDIGGSVTGRITIGVTSTRGAWFIPQLFARFHKKYPQVELVLMEGAYIDQLKAVRNGSADFAFTGYAEEGLENILIAERDILLATRSDNEFAAAVEADPVPGPGEIQLSQFAKAPFILLKKGRGIRRMADHLFRQNDIHPHIAYETSSYNMALGLAREGLGCTFVVNHEVNLPANMAMYRIAGSDEKYQLHLVYRSDTYLSQPMKDFIEMASEIDPTVRRRTASHTSV